MKSAQRTDVDRLKELVEWWDEWGYVWQRVSDVDRLKELVEGWDEWGYVWQRVSDETWALIDRAVAAARLVVAGQPLWWCEEHSSKWFGGVCETAFIEGHHNRDCRKVEGWWMA